MGYEIQKYLPTTIGIGSNGGGEMIAFDHGAPRPFTVVLVPFIGMDVGIEIGISFTDFLERLDSGREWFD